MSKEILEGLKNAVMEYDAEKAAVVAKRAVEEHLDPMEVVDVLTQSIRQVGDGFGRGEFFLPDLIGAADAMGSAMPIIEEEIKRIGAKRASLGVVVIGTVFGDIHSIGKAMVSTLLTAEGFEVHDLGVNIQAEEFLGAIQKHGADILAMSALLTTTAAEQRKVVELLGKEGLREKLKVMVGGGAVTDEFAKDIGADGYNPTAPGAAKLARKLVGK